MAACTSDTVSAGLSLAGREKRTLTLVAGDDKLVKISQERRPVQMMNIKSVVAIQLSAPPVRSKR